MSDTSNEHIIVPYLVFIYLVLILGVYHQFPPYIVYYGFHIYIVGNVQ